jgi:hypothetical protein
MCITAPTHRLANKDRHVLHDNQHASGGLLQDDKVHPQFFTVNSANRFTAAKMRFNQVLTSKKIRWGKWFF